MAVNDGRDMRAALALGNSGTGREKAVPEEVGDEDVDEAGT